MVSGGGDPISDPSVTVIAAAAAASACVCLSVLIALAVWFKRRNKSKSDIKVAPVAVQANVYGVVGGPHQQYGSVESLQTHEYTLAPAPAPASMVSDYNAPPRSYQRPQDTFVR
jgi:hypothetical protein